VALLVPLAAVLGTATLTRPARRTVAAAILATAWCVVVLVPLNLVAVRVGWWSFDVDGGDVAGLPVDLVIGWSLMWGALPALVMRWVHPTVTGAALGVLDLGLMPVMAPVVGLGPDWLWGEALVLALALGPSCLLAWSTVRRRWLGARVAVMVGLTGALFLALPLALVVGSWPGTTRVAVVGQVAAVPLAFALAGVREFAVRGGGTPLPYDPPQRLVTTGPYAYLRNPMQAGLAWGYLVLAVGLREPALVGGTVVVVTYGVLVAMHEDGDLRERFGEGWVRYSAGVRTWVPRWRAWRGMTAATLVVASDRCGVCDSVGRLVSARRPTGLVVVPVGERTGLRAARYESADGWSADGVGAVAAALQHASLPWAALGILLGLPIVRHFVQLVVDGVVGSPGAVPLPAGPTGAAQPRVTTR
jgi:protein-S-isoprenylcysteine O-methyltransferase Ste14